MQHAASEKLSLVHYGTQKSPGAERVDWRVATYSGHHPRLRNDENIDNFIDDGK